MTKINPASLPLSQGQGKLMDLMGMEGEGVEADLQVKKSRSSSTTSPPQSSSSSSLTSSSQISDDHHSFGTGHAYSLALQFTPGPRGLSCVAEGGLSAWRLQWSEELAGQERVESEPFVVGGHTWYFYLF